MIVARPMERTLVTAEELLHMDGEFELDEGVLVPVSRGGLLHGAVCARLNFLLWGMVGHRCHILGNDTGFWLERDPDTVRGPDVAVIRRERVGPDLGSGWWEGGPDLALEVLSPNDRPGDVQKRVGQFLAAGCPEMWVIDPVRRRATVYRQDGLVEIVRSGEHLECRDLEVRLALDEALAV